MATDTTLAWWIGREATLATAPNGAWLVHATWTDSDVDDYVGTSYYIPSSGSTAGNVSKDTAGAITLNNASGNIYGQAAAVNIASTTVTSDSFT